jgi:hypothetical protein
MKRIKGRHGAPFYSLAEPLAETIDPNSAADFSQFSQRKFNNFFFRFNDLLNDLVHDFLRALRSF